MGGALFCQRRRSFAELDVPVAYEWEGIFEDRIEAYCKAKEDLFDAHQTSCGLSWDDFYWVSKLPQPKDRELLMFLLLRRTVALVHVLRPIEEARPGLLKLHMRGCMLPSYWESYQRAEAMCAEELRLCRQEFQCMDPNETNPNGIIRQAVMLYNAHGINWPQGARNAHGDSDEGNGNVDTPPPPFTLGQKVKWANSDGDVEEDEVGEVVGGTRKGHVRVKFARGTWAFGRHELCNPEGGFVDVWQAPPQHPDAQHAPVARLNIMIPRKAGESLGLSLSVEAEGERKTNPAENYVVVKAVMPDGAAARYNRQETEKRLLHIQVDDRIVAVLDVSSPERKEKPPVSGDSGAIMDVIKSAKGDLMLFIVRVLGPPLRFKTGQRVEANCGGAEGWLQGCVVDAWVRGPDGGRRAYAIRLDGGAGRVVFAPLDSDDYVRKGTPRFKPGDKVVANRGRSYDPGRIVEVRDQKTSTGYLIRIQGSGDECVIAPDDIDACLRPVARFKKGTKVLAKVDSGFAAGVVENVYDPRWIYAIRLDNGNVVTAPEDTDHYVKAA